MLDSSVDERGAEDAGGSGQAQQVGLLGLGGCAAHLVGGCCYYK